MRKDQHWREEPMDWRYGEPALEEMLSDPIVQALMTRDQVERTVLSELIDGISGRRRTGHRDDDGRGGAARRIRAGQFGR
jgi:hypothetical protein